MSFTERIANWSVKHRRRVIVGWVAAVIGLAVVAGVMGTKALDQADQSTGDTARAQQILNAAGLTPDGSEAVLITSSAHGAHSQESAAVAESLAQRLGQLPHVRNVKWNTDELVAADGKARLVTFDLDATGVDLSKAVAPAVKVVQEADRADDGFTLQQFGDASVNDAIMEIVAKDLSRSEAMTLPITLVILFATFGALVAAGLPLLIGAVSVFAALSLGTIVSHVVPQAESSASLVTMLGIALGVDYTLFLLRREREERAAGKSPRQALARAAASSGTAIVISGITVIVALSGLLVSGTKLFVSMGIASMIVVAVVMVGAIVVLPAILSKLGDGVERGRLPFVGRIRERLGLKRATSSHASESKVWAAIARMSARRPLVTAVVVGLVLLSACIPALGMKTGEPGIEGFPKDEPVTQAYLAYNEHFPGQPEPAQVAIRAEAVSTPGLAAAIKEFGNRAQAQRVALDEPSITTSADGRTQLVSVALAGGENRGATKDALVSLRKIAKNTIGKVNGVTVAIGGTAADNYDFNKTMNTHMPLVFAVVLGSAFLLLTCAFRSIVVPAVAVGLNLLSVGVAYGFLTWGFQNGNLDGLLSVAGGGVVVSWMPLFLFTLLFGLSMDYHVFMISRIRERVEAGYSTRDAVVSGVARSASTITSAALIMVSVFLAFSTSHIAEMQQMGAGLAVAILIDATIIRGLLLPAVMTLLGSSNWYLPAKLSWLPRIQAEGRAEMSNAVAEKELQGIR